MARVCVWFLRAAISVLIVQGKQYADPLSVPEEVKVYPEGDMDNLKSVWKLNIEWKDGFPNSITPDKVTYDVKIFYTEQEKLIHNETIELKANQTGHYKWTWTSPIPLQCTSHSVQLRYREHDHTSAWTHPETLPGKDISDIKDVQVYPQNHLALVSEGIRFCCILNDERFTSTEFIFRISNQTYVTKPIQHSHPSPPGGFDINCKDGGATYYTGYAPADHNLTCETRDLSSVECHWIDGQEANISELVKSTGHSINGRSCTPRVCVLNQTIDTGVMNWTLTVTNALGTKIIFDTADPKHRVHLKAPTTTPITLFTARNATLEWIWQRVLKHSSFPMICQVEVNGDIINETFKGKGLTSVVLTDLQPLTEYKARVRCGSHEHFYKWGDWSKLIIFTTKEDIPEAVDVWMQVFGEQTYVVWKNAAKSHGNLTGYEVVIGSSADNKEERIPKSSAELWHKLQARSAKTHHIISVYASNSVGVSRPSSISIPIPNLSPGGVVDTSDIKGNNGTFDVVWKPSPSFKCGYVLDWYPTYEAQQCAIKWIKLPTGVSNAKVSSDLKEGVKYTLTVYGCTSEAQYTMLQRREGYVVELAPSGTVQNLTANQEGLNVHLSWRNVHERERRGYIKGYEVSYSNKSGNERNVIISDPSIQMHKFINLSEEIYTFTVKAFTSAGNGPGSMFTLSVSRAYQVGINVVAGLVVMILVLCTTAVLAYRNWKWLKSMLWPDVPKPEFSKEFLKKGVYKCQVLNQLLYEESEVLKVKTPEICPALTVQELQKEHDEAQALNSPHTNDSTWTENYQTPKSNPETLPLIIVDLSYTEIPAPGIQNPTYNLPLTPAPDNVLVSSYRPQIQSSSIQHS